MKKKKDEKCKKNKECKCPNMIFDELWGEWKCVKYAIRLYGSDFCKKKCKPCKLDKNDDKKKDKKRRTECVSRGRK